MRLARRFENGRQVRVVQWSGDAETDVGAFVLFLIVTIVCAGASIGAAETAGWTRALLVVTAALSGVVWISFVAALVLFGVVLAAIRARRVTAALDSLLVIVAAGLGAASGADAYQMGPTAIVLAPIAVVLAATVLWPRLRSRAARVRFIALGIVAVIASTAVGASEPDPVLRTRSVC